MRLTKRLTMLTVLISMLVCMFPAVASAGPSDGVALSIQDALSMAYKDNPDLRKAGLSVDRAQLLRDDAADYVTWIPSGGLVLPAYQQVMNSYQQADIGLSSAKKAQAAEKDRVTKEVISAYTKAVKDYNNLENVRLNLEESKNQKRVSSLAKEIGLVSDYNYQQLNSGIKQLEETYKGAQSGYRGSIAALAALLGKDSSWQPQLCSKVVANKFERNSLAVELSRGTSESILVWTKKALLDVETSKKDWILPNISSDMQNINLNMAEVDYEQAKRTARSTIEGLYYGIDALEGQIEAAEVTNAQAQKDLEIAQLKYDLGIISETTLTPGGESLAAARLAAAKARISLDNARADLASLKANFAYLTGQTVYDEKDWSIPIAVNANS